MFLLIALYWGFCHGFLSDSQGPQFLHDFVPEVLFSSQTGGHVDCMARGQPPPAITWTLVPSKGYYGANPVSSVPGLRHVSENGSLIFPPFSAEQLRPAIHQSIYRCVASNPSGKIVSPDIHVKAVVWQNFEAIVYDQRVYRGDTAVFRCHIPANVKSHVTVTSWVQEGGYDIFPSVTGDGRHLILPNGDLHVLHVGIEDTQRPYKCRVIDKITGQSLTSTPGRLILLTDSKAISAPRLAEVSPVIKIRKGEDVALPCVAYGHPKPQVRWLRQASEQQSSLSPVMLGDRQRLLGASLYLSSVQATDGGRYVCVANNSAGGGEASTLLVVQEQLRAHVDPPLLIVDATQSALFRCVAVGQPQLAVVWLKNGQRLYGNNHVAVEDNGYRLRVLSMQREDQGMYQCILSNEDDSAQGYAELRLGAFPPKLVYTFIRQTVQPGPSVSLKCSAVGNPVPHFAWSLDGFPLPVSERFMIGQYVSVHGEVISHVNISSVHVEDGGNYQCQAENKAGKMAHSAPLHVFGAPYVRPMGKVQAVAGGRFELICPAAGYPIENILWEKDGRQLPTNLRQRVFPNGTLVIDPVERLSDKGTYHCEARNRQGHSAKQSVHIDVIDPPQIMPLSVPVGLNLGDRLALQCVVTKGDLPLRISWEKDGLVLDGSLDAATRSINAFTSSLFVESLNLGHAGIYTCVAANHAGKVSQFVNVTINVPPRISPFSFPDLTQGSRVQVSCSVYEGDPPFTFQWIKDQNRIMPDSTGTGGSPPLPHLRVTDFNEYSSILTMDHVTAVHDGQYTCVASNAASHGQHSAYLRVSVPPEWVTEPRDVHVMAGHLAELNCAARGFPEPTITWRYTLDKSKGQFGNLADPRFQIEPNGTLLIRNVVKSDEGYYLCEAQNGIGNGLSSVIMLTVNAPPKIISQETKVSVRKNAKAIVKCHVQGDLPLYVHWKKDGVNFEPSYRDSARYDIRERQSHGTVSELSITNVNPDDGGHYECWTNNAHGQDRLDFELQVQDVPQKPQDLRLQEISSRHIMLGWTMPHDGHSPLTEFNIFYKDPSDENYRSEATPPNQSWGVVTGLRPATLYHFYVTAGNAVGASPPSDTVTALTEEEAPAGLPVEVSVGALTSRELRVSWSPPQASLRNGVIVAYNIGIKEAGDTSNKPYNITMAQSTLSERTDWRLSGLRPYTLYAVVVQAFNGKGQGPFSTEVMARTLEDAPDGPPRELTCVALSSQSLQVTWQAPALNERNGMIQGYKVFYELAPSGMSYELVEPEVKMTSEMSVYLSGLNKFANYSVQVLAFTRIGDGKLSPPMYCLTAEDVPDPPGGIKAVISSHDAILLTWLSPPQANGRILRFAVFIREIDSQGQEVSSQKKTVSAHVHHYEMRGLRKRTNFLFQVSAFTKAGEGPRSNGINLNFAPSDRVPVAVLSMGTAILLPWKSVIRIPCLAVGDSPLHVRWTKNGGQILIDWSQMNAVATSSSIGANWPVIESQGSGDKSPHLLNNGTLHLYVTQASDSGNYSCSAKNKFSDDYVSYSLAVMVPPAPPVLHYAISDFSSVSLRWSVAEHYKDAPIHGFLIKYRLRSTDQVWKEEKLSFTTRAMKIERLTCGSEYEFFLVAFNRIGASDASAVVVARTKGNPPHWVANHEESFAISTTSITLYFHGWEDRGCSIQQYVIRYRLSGQSDWVVAGTETPPATNFMLGGLLPSSAYVVRLSVMNSAGSTDREYSLSTKALGIEGSRPVYIEDQYALGPLLSDPRIAVPIAISILALALTAVTIGLRLNTRRQQHSSPDPKLYNSCSSNEAREEASVYASIGKRSPAKHTLSRPHEDSEEVYPYAVFPTPMLPDEPAPSPKTFRAFFFDKSEGDLSNFSAQPSSEYEYIHPVGERGQQQQHRRPRRPLPTAFSPKPPPTLQSRLSDSDSELELAAHAKPESLTQFHAAAAAQALQSQYRPPRATSRRQAQLSWHAQETLAMVEKAELACKESKGQQTTDMTRDSMSNQRTFPRRYPPH